MCYYYAKVNQYGGYTKFMLENFMQYFKVELCKGKQKKSPPQIPSCKFRTVLKLCKRDILS